MAHFLKPFEQVRWRFGLSVFPFPDVLGDDPDLPSDGELGEAQISTGSQDPIGRGLAFSRIVSKEVDQSWPQGNLWSHLIPLPAVILLAKGVQMLGGLCLCQVQGQPPGAQVLPQGLWLQNEPFMDQVSEPDRRFGGLEGEVAKWQNRVTRILPVCDSDGLPS